jgi:DNA-binding beta-propeller fold protein YncE
MASSETGLRVLAAAGAILLALTGSAAAQDQQSTGPRLDFPAGLATDGRAVYVSNSRNNTISAIDLTSHSLAIVAGELFKDGSNDGVGPAARFNSPDGMTISGNALYLADTNNSDIRKIDLGTRAVTTLAGTANISGTEDGHGGEAHFNLPTQVANDGTNLYIADSGNNTIRRVGIADPAVKTIGGQAQQSGKDDGPATKSTFNQPRGIVTDGKMVYISDTGNELIRKIDLSSMTTSTIAGTGEAGNADGAGAQAQFNSPGALCLSGGTLYVLDADNHAIRKIDTTTNAVSTLTLVNGHLGSGCAISSDGHTLYFSDTTENSVQQVDTSNGNFQALYPLGQ